MVYLALFDSAVVLPSDTEIFSTICFEALLDFTLRHSKVAEGTGESLEIPFVLSRCEKVITSLSNGSGSEEIVRGMHALRCIKSVLANIKQSHLAKGMRL